MIHHMGRPIVFMGTVPRHGEPRSGACLRNCHLLWGCPIIIIVVNKGAPGSESRTGPRLVSPAAGGEKKKWNLL